jgi:hypothetical protein
MSSSVNSGFNRNGAGGVNMVMYVLGVVGLVAGVYVSTITRINLFTGQTTSPYLGVGIPLALVGVALIVIARVAAKRNLVR